MHRVTALRILLVICIARGLGAQYVHLYMNKYFRAAQIVMLHAFRMGDVEIVVHIFVVFLMNPVIASSGLQK